MRRWNFHLHSDINFIGVRNPRVQLNDFIQRDPVFLGDRIQGFTLLDYVDFHSALTSYHVLGFAGHESTPADH